MGWLLAKLAGAFGPWIIGGTLATILGLTATAGVQTYRLQSCQMRHLERDRIEATERADTAEANAKDLREGFQQSIADLKALHRSNAARDARLATYTDRLKEALANDTCAHQPVPVAVRRELCLEQGGADCPAVPDSH